MENQRKKHWFLLQTHSAFRRLHLVLPWGRRERHSPCHGPESVLVFMVRHMNLKKGAWKNDRLNHQKYINISFKYKSSGVPRKRKPCWILGLQIFRTQSSDLMFLRDWIGLTMTHILSTSIWHSTTFTTHYSPQYLQWFGPGHSLTLHEVMDWTWIWFIVKWLINYRSIGCSMESLKARLLLMDLPRHFFFPISI